MEKFKPKKIEEPTDMELALYWVGHIENPCEDENGNNVRSVYLREVKKILEIRKFENPFAKKMLEDVIKRYE